MFDTIDVTAVDALVNQVAVASEVLANLVKTMPPYFQVCVGLSVVGMFVRIFYNLYR